MYGDIIYYNCISVHSDYAWCSLDKKFQGRWRYCTGNDPPVCTFPFRFRNKYVQKCTKEGYIFNRTWCSLTSNYDADGKWKQCSPYKV
ncbi:binder of sperm protein homolog 2-like isoform X2 [Eptesicus fuscus]|nr:binder of sperm protein homolog 2-like isoform X2 [Eptesicus fuscus]